MIHEKAARPVGSAKKRCTCGQRWNIYDGQCNSLPALVRITRVEFEDAFFDHYKSVLSEQLLNDIIDAAIAVEGGFCYWQVMAPFARDMYGVGWSKKVDQRS